MAEPSDRDGGYYPKGKLSVGGVKKFRETMDASNIASSSYELHPGFIPDCFDSYKHEKPFSFALVDVDQYDPTLESLNWIWPRLAYGGALLLDDYFPGRRILASGAIDKWLENVHSHTVEIIKYEDTQLYLRKRELSAFGSFEYHKSLLRD